MRLTAQDHARVTAAVTAAEARTDGEIVTIVARRSDAYHDVALHWSVLVLLLVLAALTVFPDAVLAIHAWFDPWSPEIPLRLALTIALLASTIAFLLARAALAWRPLRLALTPRATKARRARARALMLFRTGAERRTVAATGVLLYLSIEEHHAEIIADAAMHGRVAPEAWGEAMAVLIAEVRAGRPGDGMAAAIERIGAVLAEHFPRSANDVNELPDRLIEL